VTTLGDIFKATREELEKQKREIADSMLAGKCSSFEEYKRLVGVGEGLTRAQKAIKDKVKLLHADDQ